MGIQPSKQWTTKFHAGEFLERLRSSGISRFASNKGWIHFAIFLFFLSSLILMAPNEFWKSDGYVQYAVAERFIDDGRLDLPTMSRWPQVQPGPDGRLYTRSGLGQSILYSASILADRLLIGADGLTEGDINAASEPGFFSTTANAWMTALTAVWLMSLLEYFRIPFQQSLLAALMYVFGTIALIYAGLSFDVVLSALLLLGAFLFLFRTFPDGGLRTSLFAGLLFGGAFATRPFNALFAIPVAYFILVRIRSASRDFKRYLGRMLVMGAAAASVGALQLLYNWHRFGAPWAFGYETSRFTSNLAATLFAVLISPGRGLLFYATPAALGILGVRAWLRRYPAEAGALLLVAAINLCVYGIWRGWDTPRTWGPRFQLLTVAVLVIPLGFWLSRHWQKWVFKVFTLAIFAASFGIQAAASWIGFIKLNTFPNHWNWKASQLWNLALSAFKTLRTRDIESLQSWWINPLPAAVPPSSFAIPIFIVALASGIAIFLASRSQTLSPVVQGDEATQSPR
jgi:hypothetical protein